MIQIYYKHIYSILKKILNDYIMWNCGMIYPIELNAFIIHWDEACKCGQFPLAIQSDKL